MPSSDSLATKPSLLLRLRDARDALSWSEFAAIYGPIIRGYCRRRGLQEADAADIGQDVLAQVAQSVRSFEYQPARGRFRDWLGTVTRNKIARFHEVQGRAARAAVATERPLAIAEDPEWSAEFHARILDAALARIRVEFEAATWNAFDRVWGGDHAATEVARDLGMSLDAVYSAKSRVLRRLREEVLALADDLPVP